MNLLSSTGILLLTIVLTPFADASDRLEKEQITIIHAGTLLAIPGEPARNQQSLVIENGKILAIVDGFASSKDYQSGADVEIKDLSDKFVMPGMMDMHVHLTMGENTEYEEANKTSDADFAMIAVENANKTLMAGITTIRDLSALSGEAIMAVRDAINRNTIPGPRIIAAGKAISATAGHADHFGVREDYAKLYLSSAVCDGADDCRRAVRSQYKLGAEVIKIMATGGGADKNGKKNSPAEMFDDELIAIVDAAHRLGLKVTAHAHGTDGINAALSAGVDSVEHSSFLNNKSIKLFKKTGAHIVPTASLSKFFQEHPTIPDFVKQSLQGKAVEVDALLAKAYKKGVTISMGSDAGISKHGYNAQELVAYVAIGMTPMAAIQTATINTASLLGMSDTLGTLEVGKNADIIAMDTSPLNNIKAVTKVSFVMRNGISYKHQ